jgi:TonB-linked SusC/RagA family outer membrane protein
LVPGLAVLDHGGFPGDDKMNMQIRGVSSIHGTEPLVLVDGAVQSLNGLDPKTIESISVLKDAASTAIYGSRGSNGIILITTKKGMKGKLRVSYEGSYGIQKPTTYPTFLGTEDLFKFRNDLAKNSEMVSPGLGLPVMTESEIQEYVRNSKTDPRNYPPATVDMDDYFYNTAPQTQHSLSLDGGGEFVQSRASISYFYQEGIVWERSYERISARVNNSLDIAPTLKGRINLYYEHGDQKRQNDGNYEFWLYHGQYAPGVKPGILPFMYFYDEEGNYFQNNVNPKNTRMEADVDYMGLKRTTPDLGVVNTELEWTPVEGLKFSTMYAIQKTWWNQESNLPKYNLGWASRAFNALEYQTSRTTRNTFNVLANYSKTWGKHDFNTLLGYSTEEYRNEFQRMYGRDFFNNQIRNISSGKQNFIQVGNNLQEWGLRSYFGRLSYNFAEKYYTEVSLRSDGSSRFPEENRYSQFPGVSLAWRISNEKFWSSLSSVIPLFKVRYSYGQTGTHDGIGNYTYIPQLNVGQAYNFASAGGSEYEVNTVNQSVHNTEDLAWEKVIQNNVGVDLGFLENKLTASFDVFQKNTEGILLNIPIPAIVGLNPSLTNAGKIENKGWEFSLNWKDNIGELLYNVDFGMAKVEDRIVDYAGLGRSQINWPIYYRWEGSPVFALLGYKVVGIFQTQDEIAAAALPPAYANKVMPGDYQFEDVNGDGKITWDEDAQLIGDNTPKYTFNLNVSGSWKGFDVSMLWYGAADFQTAIYGGLGELGTWSNAQVLSIMKDNYWREEGDNAHFARPLYTDNNNYSNFNDRQIADLSYFRLKSLMVGYTLPSSITDKIKIGTTRIYFDGTNILTLSKYFRDYGLDPEDVPFRYQEASDVWLAAHVPARKSYPPQLKTYNFGLQLKF